MSAIIIKNGNTTFIGEKNVLWSGMFSHASRHGAIIQFIRQILKDKNASMVIPQCDGNIEKKDLPIEYNSELVASLGQTVERARQLPFLYLPLDDDFFMNGVHFESYWIDWEKRNPIAFWRGECSGGDVCSTRSQVVKTLLNYEYADVKFTNEWKWANNNIPKEYFSINEKRVPFTEFFNYKIFLIIDGNVIASNHMWGFATGCVPIMISNKIFWFQKYLVPFRDYLPVQPDLSDLIERIEWVRNHDQEAEQIAKNAVYFSQHIFSPQFQQNYIIQHIHSLLDLQRL